MKRSLGTRRGAPAAALGALVVAAAGAIFVPARASIPEEPSPEVWIASEDRPTHEVMTDLDVSPDGSTVFVTGLTTPDSVGYTDILTIAYSAETGARIWSHVYSGPRNFHDEPSDLAVSPDGSTVFVTGRSLGSGFVTVALSAATGSQIWAAHLGPSGASGQAIAVSPDGSTVFVTGRSELFSSPATYVTVAYSASTGAQQWVAGLQGSTAGWPYDIAVSPDASRVFVTGSAGSAFATVAYSATTGAEQWLVNHSGTWNGSPSAIAVSPDSSTIVVTGDSYYPSNSGHRYVATVAYASSTGTVRWTAAHGGQAKRHDRGEDIEIGPDGSTAFVAGRTYLGDTVYFLTLAYDLASGAQRWISEGAVRGEARAIRLSPDGSNVFVTGTLYGGDDDNIGTESRRASDGTLLWSERYDSGGYDTSAALGVDPAGQRVYTAGTTWAPESTRNFVTIAYRVSSCASGHGETGAVSAPLHTSERTAGNGPTRPFLHGISCDVLAANDL